MRQIVSRFRLTSGPLPVEGQRLVGPACLLVDVLRLEHALPASEVAQTTELFVGGEVDERPTAPTCIPGQKVHRVRRPALTPATQSKAGPACRSVTTMLLVRDVRMPLPSKMRAVSLIHVAPAVPIDWSLSVMPAVLVELSSASRLTPRLIRRLLSMTRVLWVSFTEPGETF